MWTCESVQQLSNLNTSNRYCSSALSEFSSSSFSVSTQEPRPTQMSVARQLRNIAACNGQTGGNVCTVSHLVIFTVLDQRQHQTIDLVQNLLKTNPQLFEIKVRYPRSSLHFYRWRHDTFFIFLFLPPSLHDIRDWQAGSPKPYFIQRVTVLVLVQT